LSRNLEEIPVKKNQRAVSAGAKAAAGGSHTPGRKTTRQVILRASLILLVCFLVILVIGYLIWQAVLGRINKVEPGEQTLPSEYNAPTESLVNPPPSMSGITSILLLGVDTRNPDSFKERSDSMMILTIDQNNKKIKLTSLQRDMLVYFPGQAAKLEKINAANAFGGPALALRVVNDTFRLDIKDFVVVNMHGMERLIDLAGGVMIDVTEPEVYFLNLGVDSSNVLYTDTPRAEHITKPGLQLLNGRQAVAYARIRKLDSDYKRMERQRRVMQALLDSFRTASLPAKGQIVSEGLSLITTNMSSAQLTDLALKIVPILSSEIEQLQIPIKGYFTEDSTGAWVNRCDFNGMIPLLQNFIFGSTFPFDRVKEIPGAPNSSIPLPTEKPAGAPTATPKPTPPATSASSAATTATSATAATSATTATTAATTEIASTATTAATTEIAATATSEATTSATTSESSTDTAATTA
jgi:polyisoprenyl-teichoic acid--peptidoglycan teichoic acid transferase